MGADFGFKQDLETREVEPIRLHDDSASPKASNQHALGAGAS